MPQVIQWIRAGSPAPQEPSGPERAKHAAHIVSVLNRTGDPGQVEELRRIAVQGGFLSAPLRCRPLPARAALRDAWPAAWAMLHAMRHDVLPGTRCWQATGLADSAQPSHLRPQVRSQRRA